MKRLFRVFFSSLGACIAASTASVSVSGLFVMLFGPLFLMRRFRLFRRQIRIRIRVLLERFELVQCKALNLDLVLFVADLRQHPFLESLELEDLRRSVGRLETPADPRQFLRDLLVIRLLIGQASQQTSTDP